MTAHAEPARATSSNAVAPTLTAKEEQGLESRRQIIDMAATLMAERGYSGTSISAVSERSKLSASSIYWHFGSKEGLLWAVVEEGARRWFEGLPHLGSRDLAPAERIAGVFDATAASLESSPEFLRLLFLIVLERREIDPASIETVRRVRARAHSQLRHVIRVLLPDAETATTRRIATDLATLALVVADGAFIGHHIDPDAIDLNRIFELLRRALVALVPQLLAEPGQGQARRQPRAT